MPAWINGETLFYGGIVLMAAAAVGVVISLVASSVSKKKLNRQLDMEYGDLKHCMEAVCPR